MLAYRDGRITKLQSLFRGRRARRAAARRGGGGGGGGGGAAVPPSEAAQIEWELEPPAGPSDAKEPALEASGGEGLQCGGEGLQWELEPEGEGAQGSG